MRAFEGRRALVTGAAQGIGRATAALLAQAGAAVHIADIDGAGIAAAGTALGLPAHAYDLSERAAAAALAAEMAAAGGCDILVNAAGGVAGQVGRPLEEVGEADWQVIFKANVEGTLWLSQAIVPGMKARGYGRLVNVASGAGLRPTLTGIQAYTAAKHALVGLTKQLSQELAPSGITVNAVAPGLILSNPSSRAQWEAYGEAGQRRILEATHTRRLGTAEDVARAIAFLAEEAAGWITGQILSVDGGRS